MICSMYHLNIGSVVMGDAAMACISASNSDAIWYSPLCANISLFMQHSGWHVGQARTPHVGQSEPAILGTVSVVTAAISRYSCVVL